MPPARIVLGCLVALGACRPTPEAPEDLSELNRYLMRHYDGDPEALVAGVEALIGHLDALDPEAPLADRAFAPEHLADDDVAGLTRPDRDLGATVNVAVARRSAYDLDANAALMLLPDQTPAEPSAVRYDRTILAPDDPACFRDRGCALLRTWNDVRRENLLMQVDFEMPKDFRWVAFDDRHALVGRSWLERSWDSEGGNNTLQQSFALDVWVEPAPGEAPWRYQVLWSETRIGSASIDESIERNTIRYGIDEALEAADEAIAAMGAG